MYYKICGLDDDFYPFFGICDAVRAFVMLCDFYKASVDYNFVLITLIEKGLVVVEVDHGKILTLESF